MTPEDLIGAPARSVGAEAIVDREIQSPRPPAEIVAGVDESNTGDQLYVLAFAVVRADQLAHARGLDPATTARLETEAARGIDAAAGQEA